MSNWRWVTRDMSGHGNDARYCEVWACEEQPTYKDGYWVRPRGIKAAELVTICVKEFEKLFGFAPFVGEIVKMTFFGKILSRAPGTIDNEE